VPAQPSHRLCGLTFSLSLAGTLAAEIRLIASTPPIIATVTRPERVLLEGTELSDFISHQQEVEQRRWSITH
jgi:hypothetical protein